MTAHPWRRVIGDPVLRSGRGSVLGGDTTRRTRWWDMTLDCGHTAERTVRYRAEEGARRGGTQRRSRSDILPSPARVRCSTCQEGPSAPKAAPDLMKALEDSLARAVRP